jgi:ribosome recycling factor
MKSVVKFGTYGFLSCMLAAQLGSLSALADADRAVVDAKKSARSMKRDVKKGVRKATGQDNAWDDAKDEAHDAVENLKDEASYHKKKIEKE